MAHRPNLLFHRGVRFSIISGVAIATWIGPIEARAATEAMLLVPAEVQSGGRSSATVTAIDGATRAPADVAVTLRLVPITGAPVVLGDVRTGASGHATIAFDVPSLGSGAASIEAEVGGAAKTLSASTTVSEAPAILIETDKPIYKPSQTIRGRVLLLDNALRPHPGEVEVTFHDAKGIRIDRKALTANEYGVAPFDLALASEVNFGVWKIRAAAGGTDASRDVRVENYVLPRYEISLEFDRSWVLVDEPIEGAVEARYFFGKPVEGKATVVAKRYVAAWEEFARAEGTFVDGTFHFQLPAVGFAAGTLGNSGQGTITFEVAAEDTAGSTGTFTDVLTVSETPVVLALVARAKTLKPEIPMEVLLTSESPDGAPLDATASVRIETYDFSGSLLGREDLQVSTSGGSGSFSFTPPKEVALAKISAEAPAGERTSRTSIELNAGWSPSSTFLSVLRSGGGLPAQAGEEVVFTVAATHSGTIFYDVYAGGRTVWSGASPAREIRFFATPDMAPKGKVVAYMINPDNEVAADAVPFEVAIPSALSITASVSKEDLRPGDPVTLTIDAGKKAMVGLSIVDLSVLSLGKSRLHLAEVFAELERRFLEPQVETHDQGGVDEPMPPFFEFSERSPGALDVLESCGLSVAMTDGIRVPLGMDMFRWWDEAMEDGVPMAGNGDAGSGSAPEPVRVRQFFPETWVWSPVLLTDDSGRATLELTAPDSITGWGLSAVGSAPEGLGFGEKTITVFQEFFVEPAIPVAVTRGEEFPVRIQIYNYLDVPQTVDLSFGAGDWFDLLGSAELTVEVPAGSATSASFPIRPTAIGEHRVEVLARGSVLSDAVVRMICVEPEGRPVEDVLNSVVRADETVPIDTSIPEFAVSGSGRAFIHIAPSPVAQTLQGVSDLLGMPYGCGEQNMIFLAPDVEVLRYLHATDQLMPEVQANAEYYVNVGYQRELTFRTDDGGFAAFGGQEGSLWLTAFVLSTFSGAREVRDIDESVLAAAAGMLAGRQEADGSFRTDDFLIHQEMDGGQSNVYSMAAFVANALADYGAASILPVLGKAASYLADRRSTVDDDPYSLAIAALALGKIAGYEDATAAMVDRLLVLADRSGIGIHWEPYPIETTGYAAMALLEENRPEAAGAIEWLSTQRNSLGGYGQSTQDTVVAIRALIAAAMKVRSDLDLTLSVLDGETAVATFRVDASNFDLLQSAELPVGRPSGLALRAEGAGSAGFQVALKYNVPGSDLPPPRDLGIEVIYDAEGIEVDDTVDVIVRVRYSGPKGSTGMTIVDVGIPTGFEAIRSSLDALTAAGTVSRVEVAGRKVIFYLDGLAKDSALEFLFQVRALYPVRAEGPISRAYEYYDPDVQASTTGPSIVVGPSAPATFIRGDANGDTELDLSDAVTVLQFLFAGSGAPMCRDAADTNDDGRVDISDPISLLGYLFLGDAPPPPPHPEAGPDATADALDC
jgi:CD109 antigen